MTDKREIRNYKGTITRSNPESRIVEGVAVVFDSDSNNMGFVETISRGAISQETIDKSDIFATLDHDASRGILARSRYGKGSLQLDLRDDGLHYSFEAPRTPLGDELLEYLTRGDITSSSFAFVVDKEDGDKWYRDESNQLRRRIDKIYRLYDVSPVFEPAYQATSVTTRKMDEIKAIDEKLDGLKQSIEKL